MINQKLTIRTASRLLEKALISSEQLASFCHSLAVAGEDVWGLAAYSHISARDSLLDHAKESDLRRKHGKAFSILDGIPVSVKENIAVREAPLTAGSRILGRGEVETTPCGYDADVVNILLRECGALLVGTTSMDEFGMGSLGINSLKPTKNPLLYMNNLYSIDIDMASADNDMQIAKMIQLSPDEILEKHSQAFSDDYPIYSAGGSSCGSAASVAHGSALLSLGTDTGGSIRLPAAWCGIVGVKPSYGVLSRHGVVSYASSFDTVGILAPSVDCASIALDLLGEREGTSSRDSTSSPLHFVLEEVASNAEATTNENPLSGMKIGIPSSFSVDECPPEINEAWLRAANYLSQHGAEIEEISTDDISIDFVKLSLATYYILVSAEASSNLSRYDGFRYGPSSREGALSMSNLNSDLTPLEKQYSATRMEGFGTEVSRRILCGASVLSSDRFHSHYEAAAKLRAALASQMHSVLENKVDLLLYPTALFPPCRIDEGNIDSTEMFANDVMTVPASLAGLPSVSVPVSLEGGIPFLGGLQLVGPRHGEYKCLKAAKILESASTQKQW
jgi:aspartyl-tRNA(Asn)/glutamyl-tRNA(Gln) amidotransferase subunit A